MLVTAKTLAASTVVLAVGGMVWSLSWFSEPVQVPRWILLLFLLTPVGDIQQIISLSVERVKERIRKSDTEKSGDSNR